MTDFKLAGIVSAVGFGLGYLLSGRSSQVMEAVQGEYGITYMESHNDAKNQHKYYLLLTSGKDNYTAYGRLPGYGREATMKLDKQPSASKMKELAMNKMKTYQLVGHKYDQIPSEIRAKLETAIGVKPSSPPAESKPQKKEPKKPMDARLAMAMKRRQVMGAEYQPDQEIGDYSVSEIAKSSAIEGYQPNKYSYGPIGYGAEMKLKKDSCCCGATKAHPCLCMIKGVKQCSAKSPMCPCYKEIAMGTKVEMEHTTSKEEAEKIAKEHLAEHPDYYSRLKKAGLSAETIIPKDFVCWECGSANLKTNVEIICEDCGLVHDESMQTVKRKPLSISDRSKYGCWGFRVPIMDDPDFVKIDWKMNAESSDSIPKANPADKEETFAWVKREHPHIKTEADKEMDEYNYAALTYHPEELESGAVNALKAGDLEAAQNFVKAINRQKFIKAFQAERNR